MQRDSRISFVVLTYNEEKHIARCINSLLPFAKEIWVIDSFSTDRTIESRRAGSQDCEAPL